MRTGAALAITALLRRWPRAVAGGLSLNRVTAAYEHTCGVTPGNRAYCWGANAHGQLGDGTFTTRPRPVAVSGGIYFKQLRAGGWTTVGKNGAAVGLGWGLNDYIQATGGNDGYAYLAVPTRIYEIN